LDELWDERLRDPLELPEAELELELDPDPAAEPDDALGPAEPVLGTTDPELTPGTGDVGTLAFGSWTEGADTDGGVGVRTDGTLTLGVEPEGVLTVGVDSEGVLTDGVRTEGALADALPTEGMVRASLVGVASAASVMNAAARAIARRRPARTRREPMPLTMCVNTRVPVISVVLSSR
jgi:hypothetical protein